MANEVARRYKVHMEEHVKKSPVPGHSWVVFTAQALVSVDSIGMANLETNDKMTPAHKFNTASTGKAITCAAISAYDAGIWDMTVPEAWPYNLPYVHKDWMHVKMSDFGAMIGGIDDEKAMAETSQFSPDVFEGDPYCSFMVATRKPGNGSAPPVLGRASQMLKT